jgi:hypothetical protein
LDGGEDIAGFVAGGDDDGAVVMGGGEEVLWAGAGDHEDGEAEVFEEGGDPAIEERAEDGGFDGPEDAVFFFDLFPAGEMEEVAEVVGGEPVLLGCGGFGAEGFGEFKDGAPEVVEGIQDEAGLRGSELVEVLEDGLDIGEVIGEVGEDDVIELAGGGGGIGGAEVEFEVGEAFFGLLDDGGAEVDTDAVGGVEGMEEFTGAAADFEDAGLWGDEEAVVMLHEPLVVAVQFAIPLGCPFLVEGLCRHCFRGGGRLDIGDGRWEMGDGIWDMGDGRWEMGVRVGGFLL